MDTRSLDRGSIVFRLQGLGRGPPNYVDKLPHWLFLGSWAIIVPSFGL